ncbi:discoidin domain-containing protein [Planosporangium mesophilum]|uniref:alpha-L-fucosidase n=1 Tax=Planosporangium mesophilum TaxID=689768 RepID=A0A8J3TDT5_9ACTN|nr:discoidin domain-containing protein [Planosporangium mesophilum]NJC82859.1 alpha-L-fucosidase [Planosporangium mesophilum]GII23671.1 alpha-L-fucosidase [Planosporangium mesophilum]
MARNLRSGRRRITRLGVFTTILGMLLAALGAPPARAEVFHPRQLWMRDATAGLFLHWGLRTTRSDPAAPPFTDADCAAWEAEVTGSGWSAGKWVTAARQLHAQYLVLASFHSRLGYARAWPSQIPGSCSTRRDFLGETIAAARAKGLKVILYMTDDPQWYWEGLRERPVDPKNPDPGDVDRPNWFDSHAYSAYKGRPVNLTTRDGFGEFSYDNFFEVMRNYPDLAGFWIDNDNKYWEDHDLYRQVHQLRPRMLLSNNNEDTPEMDTVSNEQKTGMTPPYDYNSALWTSMPRLTESCYKLPARGAWWYDGEGPNRAGGAEVDKKLNVGRFISNVGASSKALEAETSTLDGSFPPNQAEFNAFMSTYLTPIWESVHGVEGGGYLYGGLQPGAFNDGAYGYTTIGRYDRDRHYIHVIDKPATGTDLKVRDNGYVVTTVHDVRSGKKFDFSQRDGFLTIKGITAWDPYDTVFRVQTHGRTGIYRGVTATASVSAPGHDASALVDGDHTKYWDNAATVPASITLDLGRVRKVAYVAVNQREWSPTQPRTSFGHPEDSARIKDYTVEVSTDGVTWTPARSDTMRSARAVQFIDLDVAGARYVRLTVTSTWAAATLPEYDKKLRIDELWVGGAYPSRA